MNGPRIARVLRESLTWSALGLLVAGAAGFAWLTRHPDTPLVARAAELPVLGAAARLFQARWLPPPGGVLIDPAWAGERSVERVWVPIREVEVEDFFHFPAPPGGSTREREQPEASRPIGSAGAIEQADLLGPGWKPWDGIGLPPLGDLPMLNVPLPGRPADPERVAVARSLFDATPVESRLGPYSLLTDVEEPALLVPLAVAAEEAELLYVSRYGLSLRGEAAETIVVYRSEEAYRGLQDRSGRIRGMAGSRGHVGWGLVALYAGGREEGEAAGMVLRHELAHLLSRRALGPALPPWLDEGIADDFAAHQLDDALVPRESRLEDLRSIDGDRIQIRGALASLAVLAAAQGSGASPPLESLLGLDWEVFVAEPAAGLHYAASAWLVRYLLARDSGHAPAFRAFLRRVARGGGVEARDLEAALGRPWPEIEEGFRRYVAERAAAAGVGVAPASGTC